MNNLIMIQRYGDYGDGVQSGGFAEGKTNNRNGRYGKYLSDPNKASITNMWAAYMPSMQPWQLKMREMYIPAGRKV